VRESQDPLSRFFALLAQAVDAPDQPGRRVAGDASDPAGHPGSLSRRCHGEGFRYVRAGGCVIPASGGSQVAAPGPHRNLIERS
jgi:hypothetical protein